MGGLVETQRHQNQMQYCGKYYRDLKMGNALNPKFSFYVSIYRSGGGTCPKWAGTQLAFVSNENLVCIPGDAVFPEEPRNLVEHPNGGVTKRVMCTVIHTTTSRIWDVFQGTQWSRKNPETSWNIQTEG